MLDVKAEISHGQLETLDKVGKSAGLSEEETKQPGESLRPSTLCAENRVPDQSGKADQQ